MSLVVMMHDLVLVFWSCVATTLDVLHLTGGRGISGAGDGRIMHGPCDAIAWVWDGCERVRVACGSHGM
jgi:hypothetical protein